MKAVAIVVGTLAQLAGAHVTMRLASCPVAVAPVPGEAAMMSPSATATARRQRDPSWRDRAACRAEDLAVFFPPRGSATVAAVAKARAICARCLVREACLAFAHDFAITSGVWGGLTPDERREHRRGQAEARRRERDAAIVAAAADGHTREQLAEEFGVTASLVGKILAAQRGTA